MGVHTIAKTRSLLLGIIGIFSGIILLKEWLLRPVARFADSSLRLAPLLEITPPISSRPKAKKETVSVTGNQAGVKTGDAMLFKKKKETDSKHHAVRGKLDPVSFLKELLHRYNVDQCGSWAASLSFYSLLSIAPILLCGLAVLGFLIQDPQQAAERVQSIIANLLPGDDAYAMSKDLIAQMQIEKSAAALMQSRGVAGFVGVLSLFWTAMHIFVNAMTPINAAFRAKETRGFIKQRVYALGLMLGAGLLFLLSLLPASGAQVINSLHIPGVGMLPDPLPPLIKVAFFMVGVVINAVMFALIYRYLPSPSARVHWRHAGIAGFTIAILWEAAKLGFAFYLSRFGNYNKVYGSLGGLVALIFWVYYSSMILLLGAEIASMAGDTERAAQESSVTES